MVFCFKACDAKEFAEALTAHYAEKGSLAFGKYAD